VATEVDGACDPKFSIEDNEWFAEHETPAEQANALQQESEERHEPDRAE